VRLLDLFCGAGGAGVGYHRAGFEVVGVDIEPQPNFPFEFVQADAMTYPLDGFDAIHASPPCQAYSLASGYQGKGARAKYPELVGPTRDLLVQTGLPWVIENVPNAPIRKDLLLCGEMFGLRLHRHRIFELGGRFAMMQHPHSPHRLKGGKAQLPHRSGLRPTGSRQLQRPRRRQRRDGDRLDETERACRGYPPSIHRAYRRLLDRLPD
jgi:hypothetical protein